MFDCHGKHVYLVCGATDMRKGVNGLSAIVSFRFPNVDLDNLVVVFCNHSRNRLKVIEWDTDGFWLFSKRLEKGSFPWPNQVPGGKSVVPLAEKELLCLLSGTKLRNKFNHNTFSPRCSF